MKKILVLAGTLCIMLLGVTRQVKAQKNSVLTFSYTIGFSSSDFNDFIGDNSFRGFNLAYRYLVNDNIAVGFQGGWSNFFEKIDRTTYEFDNGAVNTAQWRYTHLVPLLVSADYFFLDAEKTFRPYAGFGLGGYITEQEVLVGIADFFDRTFRFGFAPEVGMTFDIPNTSIGFVFSGKYNFVAQGSDFQDTNLGYWTINMGIGFMNW